MEYYLTIDNPNRSVKILQLKRLVFGHVSSLDKQQEHNFFALNDSLAEKSGFPSASNFLR